MKQIYKQKGFTLLEMTVVIFIIGIIATVSLANYREGEKRKRVSIAADTITNAIRNAQNFSLTSRQIAASACAVKSPESYIIMFTDSQEIELYGVDKDPCTGSTLIERYPLPANTQIQANGYKFNGSPVSNLQIKYTTPYARMTGSTGTTVNSGTFNTFTTATITVESSDQSVVRTVTIDGISGRVGE